MDRRRVLNALDFLAQADDPDAFAVCDPASTVLLGARLIPTCPLKVMLWVAMAMRKGLFPVESVNIPFFSPLNNPLTSAHSVFNCLGF